MDQKLSQLDQRLYELTSKIQVAQVESDVQSKKKSKKSEQIEEKSKPIFEKPIEEYANKSSEKFEITTLTSLPKLDPVKQTKYDEMLSQLSSDVITPPPMKPKVSEEQKIETPEIKQTSLVPVVENKPEPVVEPVASVTKPLFNNMAKPIVELPEEAELDDDDDDDIAAIKARITKTLSNIEQAEVD